MDDSCQWNKRDRYDARLLPTLSPDGVHNQDIGCAVESVWQAIPYEIRDGPVPYTVSQIVNDPRRSYGFAPSVDGDGLTTKQQVDADAAEQEEYPPKGLCSRISGFRGLVRHVCAAFSFDMTLQIYGKKTDHANNSLSFFLVIGKKGMKKQEKTEQQCLSLLLRFGVSEVRKGLFRHLLTAYDIKPLRQSLQRSGSCTDLVTTHVVDIKRSGRGLTADA